MKDLAFLAIILMWILSPTFAQDLMKERIWRLSPRKKSIFLDKGIFHSSAGRGSGEITGVRNSYVLKRGYERIVFDFSGPKIPKVYGHISQETQKIYIDFFNSKLVRTVDPLRNTKYLKNLDFFGIDGSSLSVELSFVKSSTFDIFYLENPGRLVIDLKK